MFAMTRIAMASRSLSAGISLVGTAQAQGVAASYPVNFPAGVQIGDFVLVLTVAGQADDGYGSFPAPYSHPTISGYTLQASSTVGAGYCRSALYYKRLTALDASLTVTNPNFGTGAGLATSLYILRGVNATTPFDGTVSLAGADNYGRADPPAITTTASGGLVVAGAALVFQGTGLGSAPPGYTNLVTGSINFTGSILVGAALASKTTGSGVENPAPYPGGGSSYFDMGTGYSIALRPA